MKTFDIKQLNTLFNPKSVAAVGATGTFGKWGFNIFSLLLEKRVNGVKVYPVNPSLTEVHGVKCYKNVVDIPEQVELAVITVPAAHVLQVMRDCVKKGIKLAVVITAGFAELGAEGAEIQKEIVEVARGGGLRFIGPNTMGYFSTASDFNTCVFFNNMGKKGRVGFISQSGNIGAYVLVRGIEGGLGFSKFIGTGNEADVTLEDCLEYLGQDEETKVIILYMEGLRQGRRFFELAREITRKKPIVALKVGRTAAGMKAAQSHTSALSGSDVVYDAMYKQCGEIRVDKVNELFTTAVALVQQPLMKGNRVAVLTLGGGFGVLVTDILEKAGLEMASLSQHTLDRLDAILPPFWSHGNPVDMVASGAHAYSCLEALIDDENVDAVYYLAVTAGNLQMSDNRLKDIPITERAKAKLAIEEYARQEAEGIDMIRAHVNKYQKPVVFCPTTPSGQLWESASYQKLRDSNIWVYSLPEVGAMAIARLARYGEYRRSCESQDL